MAQHDYNIANGTGAAVRSDLNNALLAIVSNNSGATAPSPTYAYQLWADTTTNTLKLRNGANSSFITVGDLTAANLGLATLASPTFTGTATIPTLTVSSAANIPLGSAGSPTLYFTGDSNTGLYSPGADQVALSTGGTGRLFINSSGAVGIGVSSVGAQLEIQSTSVTSPSLRLRYNATSYYGDHLMDGNGNYIIYSPAANGVTSGNLRLRAGGSFSVSTNDQAATNPALTIDTSSRVGIGTSTPQHLLDCTSIGRFTGNTNSAVSGAGIEIGYDSGNTTGIIQSYNRGSSTYLSTAVDGSDLRFKISGAEKARLDSNGRLLVGTSTASGDQLLVVQGYVGVAAGNAELGLRRGGNPSVADQGLGAITFQNSSGNSGARIEAVSDGSWTSGSNHRSRLVFSTCADGSSSPTERLRIANNGAWGLAGANYGSSGQVLTSNGSGSAPTWSTASSGAGTLQAWVNFNGTGTVAIRASGNVSSITDNGVGDYTVNFTTTMPDANYSIATAYRRSGGSFGDQNMVCTAPTYGTTPATSNVRVGTTNAYSGGREDTDYLSVAIFR